jgi:hypothetical protein
MKYYNIYAYVLTVRDGVRDRDGVSQHDRDRGHRNGPGTNIVFFH